MKASLIVVGGMLLLPMAGAIAQGQNQGLIEDSEDHDYYFVCTDQHANRVTMRVDTDVRGPIWRHARSITLTLLGNGRVLYSFFRDGNSSSGVPVNYQPADNESCQFGRQ